LTPLTLQACEAVSNALYKLGGVSHLVALWGCKAIVGLSATESNRVKFHQSETCNGVVAALKVRVHRIYMVVCVFVFSVELFSFFSEYINL
jgi:hypothetical protein